MRYMMQKRMSYKAFVIDNTGEIRTYSFRETPYEYKQMEHIRTLRPRLEGLLSVSESTGEYVDLG